MEPSVDDLEGCAGFCAELCGQVQASVENPVEKWGGFAARAANPGGLAARKSPLIIYQNHFSIFIFHLSFIGPQWHPLAPTGSDWDYFFTFGYGFRSFVRPSR